MSKASRRPRVKEVFLGPRLRASVAPALRFRSGLVLVLLTVLIGATLAIGLAAGIGFAVQALLHAIGTGS